MMGCREAAGSSVDLLWEDCRNSLGIARLLLREGRPEPLVSTACRMALENACRAALQQAGLPFEGDVAGALDRLGLIAEPLAFGAGGAPGHRLSATEQAVAHVSAFLRRMAPERSWGY